jgi:hypothetical protein
MAWSFDVNNTTITGAQAIYQLKQGLKNAGWTVPRSSDGTTYNASGDQITSGSSGANGMANNNAWFVVKSPSVDGYEREFCIQRMSTNLLWRIKYAVSSTFSGGSPSATQVPSASDEALVHGGGTDSSPTGSGLFSTDSTYRYHFIYGGLEESYSFYSFGYPLGGGNSNHSFMFDRCSLNTFAPEDLDPFVIYSSNTSNLISTLSGLSTCKCWYKKNLSGQIFQNVAVSDYVNSSGSSLYVGLLGTNAWNGKDDGLPVFYGRNVASGGTPGFKGISRHLYLKCAARSTGDTISVVTSKDKIYLNDLILPWNGTSPLV